MIINPNFRKCVAYLFIDKPDENTGRVRRTPIATAFFVIVPITDIKLAAFYVVTARHVIRKSRPYGSLFMRFNLTDGTFADVEIHQDDWIEHPSTDVAVYLAKLPDKADVVYLSLGELATPKFIADNNVMEGDDIFFCGMFQGFAGQKKMQPVIRFGNIALMPHENIYLQDGKEDTPYPVEAYIIESRSWGGHSGSPAFLYLSPSRYPGAIVLQTKAPLFALLGLVSSHFEIAQNVNFAGDILGSGTVDINAGLAVIIPAHFIRDILLGDQCKDQQARLSEEYKRQSKFKQ